jgi:hypothetical protein
MHFQVPDRTQLTVPVNCCTWSAAATDVSARAALPVSACPMNRHLQVQILTGGSGWVAFRSWSDIRHAQAAPLRALHACWTCTCMCRTAPSERFR